MTDCTYYHECHERIHLNIDINTKKQILKGMEYNKV